MCRLREDRELNFAWLSSLELFRLLLTPWFVVSKNQPYYVGLLRLACHMRDSDVPRLLFL